MDRIYACQLGSVLQLRAHNLVKVMGNKDEETTRIHRQYSVFNRGQKTEGKIGVDDDLVALSQNIGAIVKYSTQMMQWNGNNLCFQ